MRRMRSQAALACLVAQACVLAIPTMAVAAPSARTTASPVLPATAPPSLAYPGKSPASLAYPGTTPADSARAFAAASASSRPTAGIVISGIGLAAGVGLAAWLKSKADDRYESYLHLADPARAREMRRSAQRYDRASLVGWGTAQVSFLALFYFLTREEKRPLIPVEGEPIVRADASGIQIGIRVAP